MVVEYIEFDKLMRDEGYESQARQWSEGWFAGMRDTLIDAETPNDQAQPPGDFVSSQVVVEKITPTFDGSELYEWLGGQNNYEMFGKAAPNVSGRLLIGSDDTIQRSLESARSEYLTGNITLAQMWEQWLEQVRNLFPELILPEPPVSE